jgi:hypothetical protein
MWINDFVKLGVTANQNDDSGNDSSLYAGDVTLRVTPDSWMKVQANAGHVRPLHGARCSP